ncbi:hypothetical protein ACE14D_18810 [Streptomyces sp. Act-28]
MTSHANRARALSLDTVATRYAAFPVRVSTREFTWPRRITIEEHVRNLETHSHFVVMEPVERAALLDANRAAPARLLPDGELDEPYRCGLTVVRSRP